MNAADVDDLLRRTAPEPAAALARLERAARHAVASSKRPGILATVVEVVAAQHRLPPLGLSPVPPSHAVSTPKDSGLEARAWRKRSDLDSDAHAILEMAEQFAFDVASVQPDQRERFFAAAGDEAIAIAQTVYAADLLPRAYAAFGALLGEDEREEESEASERTLPNAPAARPPEDAPTGVEDSLGFAVDEIIRVIPALQEIDPLTTELVRLLGARRHQCRVCQSVRSRSAFAAGGNDALFDAVEDFESASFAADQQAALAFADGFLASPARFEPDRVSALRRHFNRAAQIELVLDLTRNATNKVAVALGGDAPRVENGYEIYEVQADGEIVYGLEAP